MAAFGGKLLLAMYGSHSGHLGCPLSGGCPLFGGSAIGGSTVVVLLCFHNSLYNGPQHTNTGIM